MSKALLGNIGELQSEFASIASEYAHDDSQREQIITTSRGIIKPAKQAIYAIHRGDIPAAKELLSAASKEIATANKLIVDSQLKDVGSFRAGLEEFVEAACYLSFVQNKTIPTRAQLDLPFTIPYEVYLAGLCDVTGELARRAVLCATNKEVDEVKLIGEVLSELMDLFMKIDFRGGELRKKSDAIKYNLAKVQDITYDLSLQK